MGGSSVGGLPLSDLRRLEKSAKEKLTSADARTSRHVFISFAYEDLDDVNLLRGQARNPNTELRFHDFSVKEAFDSKNAEYIKRQIRERIDRASVTIVYLSSNSAKSKWVDWEIQQSLKRGKGVIGVYKGDTPPRDLPAAFRDNKCSACKWGHESLANEIEKACIKR